MSGALGTCYQVRCILKPAPARTHLILCVLAKFEGTLLDSTTLCLLFSGVCEADIDRQKLQR